MWGKGVRGGINLCLSGWRQKKGPPDKRQASRVRVLGVREWRLAWHDTQRQMIAISCHETQDETLTQDRWRDQLLLLLFQRRHTSRLSAFRLISVVTVIPLRATTERCEHIFILSLCMWAHVCRLTQLMYMALGLLCISNSLKYTYWCNCSTFSCH